MKFPIDIWHTIKKYLAFKSRYVLLKTITDVFCDMYITMSYKINVLNTDPNLNDTNLYTWCYSYNINECHQYYKYLSKYMIWKAYVLCRIDPTCYFSMFTPIDRYINSIERILKLKNKAQIIMQMYHDYYLVLLQRNSLALRDNDTENQRLLLYQKLMFKKFLNRHFSYIIELELSTTCYDAQQKYEVNSLRFRYNRDGNDPTTYALDFESRDRHLYMVYTMDENVDVFIQHLKDHIYIPIELTEYLYLLEVNHSKINIKYKYLNVCDDIHETQLNPYLIYSRRCLIEY